MDWFQIVTNISVVVALWSAIYGIDSWRREHTGRRQIELAEETLALFYEATDIVRYIRHPVGTSNDYIGIERASNETEKQFEARKSASVVFSRYNENKEIFNRIRALRYRFMAQIGKDEAKPFDELHAVITQIHSAARMLARLWSRDHFTTDAEWKSHYGRVDKYETIFWDTFEEDDPINSKLTSLIGEIEKNCNSVISGSGSIYAVLNRKIRRNG